MDVKAMQAHLTAMAEAREWQQFHTPKNLTMALAGEAGELLEIFQWLSEQQSLDIMKSPKRAQEVSDELADIFTYVLRLCSALDVDLEKSFWAKIKKTEAKYPIELSKGRATKYTEF